MPSYLGFTNSVGFARLIIQTTRLYLLGFKFTLSLQIFAALIKAYIK